MTDEPILYIAGTHGWNSIPWGAECWGVNNCLPEVRLLSSVDFNVTGWFQMHSSRLWRRGRNTREHVAWLKQLQPFPIYMQELHPDVPSSVAYPLAQAAALWPPTLGTGPVFSDSFCYMLALAILQDRKRIELRGVYLDDPIEAMTETEGVAYWLAIAALSGVSVGSDGRLLISVRYGYEVRHPHPSLPDDVAAQIIASEHPGARTLLNRYRRQRRNLSRLRQL